MGYELVGAATATCDDGIWDAQKPQCRIYTCDEVDLQHGNSSYSNPLGEFGPKQEG